MCYLVDGLDNTEPSERWNGSITPTGGESMIRQTEQQEQLLAPSPLTGEQYVFNEDSLPVTEAFIKNQMKYGKPLDQSTMPRRAQVLHYFCKNCWLYFL